MLLNTHFVEISGKIYSKRKAYIKWYYFDHNDYPAERLLRQSKSPIKKAKQVVQLEGSPDGKKESPNDTPDGKSHTGSPF